jgi:hypothetical protein
MISMRHNIGAKALGPVARKLVSPDRWTDSYPATPEASRELDVLLQFADERGQAAKFVSRLETRNHNRDETLNELRVAYWFDQHGFPILQWDPPGLNGMVGEYLIDSPENVPVFVELKSPGWEGDLTEAEQRTGRTTQPKYRDGDGGAFGNWQPIQRCIESPKTYSKFTSMQPNLLVIADDLKVSLIDSPEHVDIALYVKHSGYGKTGYFTSSQFENIGGLAIFGAEKLLERDGIEYEFRIFDNPFALPSTKLPDSLLRFKTGTRGTLRDTIVRRSHG